MTLDNTPAAVLNGTAAAGLASASFPLLCVLGFRGGVGLPSSGLKLHRVHHRRAAEAEIEDFLEGFNQTTYRGMRVNGQRIATWSSDHGWSGDGRPYAEWVQ
jgi:hypothetical protein